MIGLGIARRAAPDPLYQLTHRPASYLRELWGANRSVGSLARLLGRPRSEIAGYFRTLLTTDAFYSRIAESEARLRATGGGGTSPGGRADSSSEILYILVRVQRPETVVETGVALGYSSAYILQALHDNGTGTLYSIDLPTTDPEGRVNADGVRDRVHVRSASETGAVIPEDLRGRWRLTLGPSNPLLAQLFESLGPIDVFFHDSEHSYENMLWEYRQAWPRLRPGGLLLSDDVQWNRSFPEFSASVGAPAFRWFGAQGHRGAIRKPVGPA